MQNIIFIILGIVQGFSEPLPISSSGHLLIFEKLLNFSIPGISFEAFVNFGSTIAIIFYFRKKIWKLFVEGLAYLYCKFKILTTKNDPKKVKEYKKYKNIKKRFTNSFEYILKIIVSTLPLVFLGVVLVILGVDDINNIKLVGLALLVTATALLLVSKISGTKTISSISYKDCLIIGAFQMIALMPGLSRSGMTLVGALFIGLRENEAFEFVFMLYLPASIGAMLISIIQISKDPNLISMLGGYILAFIFAGVFTYLGLKLLKNIMIARKLIYFSIYCFIVGGLVIIFL